MSQLSPAAGPLERRPAFRRALLRWFSRHGRDDPWRRTTDPYAILVSEVMLQQTQVATVLGGRFFERWMERFPDPATLAAAPESEVLQAWEGLGYYRRARHLQRTARAVVEQWGGRFPDSLEELQSLPGIGRYTAGAIFSFAYNRAAPVVDANVARALARLFDYREDIDGAASRTVLWDWAGRLVSPRNARGFNAALMELGQRICLPRAPRCEECPVRGFCRAEEPASLPVRRAPRAVVLVEEHALFAFHRGRLLLHRESGRRREGLWKLPERAPDHPLLTRSELVLTTRYTITHHRVTLRVYRPPSGEPPEPGEGEAWVPWAGLERIPMPSPYRKVLQRLRGNR